jgi:hypothetical protein
MVMSLKNDTRDDLVSTRLSFLRGVMLVTIWWPLDHHIVEE